MLKAPTKAVAEKKQEEPPRSTKSKAAMTWSAYYCILVQLKTEEDGASNKTLFSLGGTHNEFHKLPSILMSALSDKLAIAVHEPGEIKACSDTLSHRVYPVPESTTKRAMERKGG